MTLELGADGIYRGNFRFKGFDRLHLSMRTKKKTEAKARYAAVHHVFRIRPPRHDLVDALRSGAASIEWLERTVREGAALSLPITGQVQASREVGTLDDVIERYLDWLDSNQNRADNTKATRRSQLYRMADVEVDAQRLGDIPFDRLTTRQIEAYQRSLIAEGKTPNTVTSYMRGAEALINWSGRQELRLAREEKRPPTPFYSPVDPETRHTHTTKRERFLDEDEAQRVLAATPAPLLFPVACGLFAGFRVGEMLHLRPSFDVDLELGTLAVKDQRPLWSPKTKRSVRVVPIAAPLRPLLEAHLAHYASERWVLPSLRDPAEPFVYEAFRQHFREIVSNAGMCPDQSDPIGVTFHTLRHTFASWLIMNQVDLYTVAQLLGDRVEEVEETYAHLAPDHKRRAIEKLTGAIVVPDIDTDQAGPSELPALTQLVTQKREAALV